MRVKVGGRKKCRSSEHLPFATSVEKEVAESKIIQPPQGGVDGKIGK